MYLEKWVHTVFSRVKIVSSTEKGFCLESMAYANQLQIKKLKQLHDLCTVLSMHAPEKTHGRLRITSFVVRKEYKQCFKILNGRASLVFNPPKSKQNPKLVDICNFSSILKTDQWSYPLVKLIQSSKQLTHILRIIYTN